MNDLIENARGNLEIARRLVMMGCAGFAASSAQLTMRLLAAALLFDRTGQVYGDPRQIAVELRRVFAGEIDAALLQYLEEGAAFELAGDPGDYLPPPSIERAREEVNRAQAFLGDVVGMLNLPAAAARISS
ncbi:MAG: hypothetical protein ABI175_12910 [Polyangiales bacterium]